MVRSASDAVTRSMRSILTFLATAWRSQWRPWLSPSLSFHQIHSFFFFFNHALIYGPRTLLRPGYYSSVFPSAISPWTTLGPLAAVLGVSLLNEMRTDLNRHNNDKKINRSKVRRVDFVQDGGNGNNHDHGNGLELPHLSPTSAEISRMYGPHIKTSSIMCQDISPGSLIHIQNRNVIPADCIIVALEGDSAYVETSNIDGETNLKIKGLPKRWRNCRGRELENALLGGVVKAELPNTNVHSFSGVIRTADHEEYSVDESSVSAARRSSALLPRCPPFLSTLLNQPTNIPSLLASSFVC